MFAVKGMRHGFRERLAAEVVSEHRRPRDGLQQRPVPAERGRQCENNQKLSKTNQHVPSLGDNLGKSSE